MKSLQALYLKTIALTKVIYTAIRSYDEQAFDNMSEASEKNLSAFCFCVCQLGCRIAIISWKHGCAAHAVPLYQYTGTHFNNFGRIYKLSQPHLVLIQ